jgi:hypothetical protein
VVIRGVILCVCMCVCVCVCVCVHARCAYLQGWPEPMYIRCIHDAFGGEFRIKHTGIDGTYIYGSGQPYVCDEVVWYDLWLYVNIFLSHNQIF